MNLTTILEEIKKNQILADENLEGAPVETLNGRRGRQKQAQEQLKILKKEYIRDMMNGAMFIIVAGQNRTQFTKIASEKYGIFSADPESFYKDLADRVAPVLYENKETVANMFDVLGRHLEDKALEMDIIGYPQLLFKSTYSRTIKNKKDFTQLIKQAINEQVGAEVVGIQAVRSIADLAIKKGHKDKITPVILSTNDEQLIDSLTRDLRRLSKNVYLILAGKTTKTLQAIEESVTVTEINAETVEQALNNIKQTLRK